MSVNRVNESTGELITLSSGVRCWIGTKAAHTIAVANHTIPNNVMVCITDDWKNKDDYSTEETDTGKHWIDGKPIYQKTFSVNLPSSGEFTPQALASLGSDVETVINFEGFIKIVSDSNAVFFTQLNDVNFATDDNYIPLSRIWASNQTDTTGPIKIMCSINSSRYGKPAFITVRYTKTTD